MKCISHNRRDAVDECAKCGKPICGLCYETLCIEDTEGGEKIVYHFCGECYQEFLEAERDEVKGTKKMVRKERLFILIGFILGLLYSISFFVTELDKGIPQEKMAETIVLSAWIPFILASFFTILRKILMAIKDGAEEISNIDSSDENGLLKFFLIFFKVFFIGFFYLAVAPIISIYRFFIRFKDEDKLDLLIAEYDGYFEQLANFLKSNNFSLADIADDNEDSVDIDIEDILASNISSIISNNGEIVRKIQKR